MLYLGVDGGGSGCRAAVADAAGLVLGRGEAASANIFTDPDGARANILAASDAALAAAGLGGEAVRITAVLGLAGANMAEAATRLEGRLPFARVRIESDALIALKGALGDADGITASLGTGSVFGLQRAGRIRMLGGWGFLLGDQGGGARIGRAGLERTLLAHDGLTPMTPLLAGILSEAGGAAAIVGFGQRARPVEFAQYAPRIVAAAAAGDAAGAAIMAEAEADVMASIERLMEEDPVPVTFLGGLGPVFAARLAGRLGALIRQPRGSGLDGALAMARRL